MPQHLFKLECLTPVHIGSGEELVRGLDFYSAGGFTEVLDSDLMLRHFGALDGFAEAIRRGVGIGEFLKGRGEAVATCRRYRVPGTIEARQLRAAIRTADGRPTIPGSSIKGALRTLLLVAWSGEGGPHAGKRPGAVVDALWEVGYGARTSSQRLEEVVFHYRRNGMRTNDPRTDVLRTLALSDAMFAPESLMVLSSLAVGTTRATLTAAEALQRGACGLIALRAGDQFVDTRLPFPNRLPDLAMLASWSHQHARHLITGDLDYFGKRNEAAIANRLEELRAEVDRAAADTILLRLGWGTGWRTMTGDILNGDERNRVMRRVGKTRKVIIEGHSSRDRPCDVFGWIKLEPVSAADAQAIATSTRPAPPVEIEEPAPAPAPTPTPVKVIPTVPPPLAQRDPFAAAIADLKPKDWGKVNGYVKQANNHPDQSERERRLRLVADQLNKIFGHDRKRMKEIAQIAELGPYLKPG
jgi:CRISPR type III-A-associated RAMP protein Csm5